MRLNLDDLRSPEDILHKEVRSANLQDGWVIGFGWDQNRWPGFQGRFPDRHLLDRWCPDRPVVLSRADGHAFWVNTKAMHEAGVLDGDRFLIDPYSKAGSGHIEIDAHGLPTGIFIDAAKSWVERKMPKPRALKDYLIQGCRIFNRAGFTHIRDLTCSEDQWHQSCLLDEARELTLAVEQFFSAETPENFQSALTLARRAKSQPSPHLRVRGVKIYMDGALGSEGAYLSQPYLSGSGRGFRCLSDDELKDQIRQVFAADLELAVHVIGDDAADIVVNAAREVWHSGQPGHLHLEHVELLRPETVLKLKGSTVTCHMQPCHWLTDHKWLRSKVGDLADFAFPWRALEENGVALFFGSDAPIERSSVTKNLEALEQSARAGIPPMQKSPLICQSYPSIDFAASSQTRFENGLPVEVIFDGRRIDPSI